MSRRAACVVVLTLVASMALVWVALANVPPPPVNQTLGVKDTVLNDLSASDCMPCHNNGSTANVNAHHLLMNTALPVGNCFTQTTVPCEYGAQAYPPTSQNPPDPICTAGNPADYCVKATQAPSVNTVPPGNYQCLSCHVLVWDPVNMDYNFADFRNCLNCHFERLRPAPSTSPREPNVHHRTSWAAALDCKHCHGSMVNNTGDGHYIPTYSPSLVTPWPDRRALQPVPMQFPPGPNGEGECTFCHAAGTDTATGTIVGSNHDNHHNTGLTRASFTGLSAACLACHPTSHGPTNTTAGSAVNDIRYCENCHGVQSLHNIQASDGTGINPGKELPYYGHIGNSTDCFGCHGFSAPTTTTAVSPLDTSSPAPYSGPIVPYIQSADVSVITAGTSAVVTLTGAALSNTIDSPTGPVNLDSTPILTAQDGSTTTLIVDSITESQMVIEIPGTLTPGKYSLTAVKGPQTSNPVALSVVPAVSITSVACSANGIVTINGGGFSEYVDATDSGTSVSSGTEKGTILSWSDTEVLAQFTKCPSTIEVSSVFGTASADVTQPPAANWTPASVMGTKSYATSNIANYVFLLVLPLGALLMWKIRSRRK